MQSVECGLPPHRACMPMTYSNNTNATFNAETSEKGSLSKRAFSFLNRKAASSRSAGGKIAADKSSSVQAYEELQSEVGADGFGAQVWYCSSSTLPEKAEKQQLHPHQPSFNVFTAQQCVCSWRVCHYCSSRGNPSRLRMLLLPPRL